MANTKSSVFAYRMYLKQQIDLKVRGWKPSDIVTATWDAESEVSASVIAELGVLEKIILGVVLSQDLKIELETIATLEGIATADGVNLSQPKLSDFQQLIKEVTEPSEIKISFLTNSVDYIYSIYNALCAYYLAYSDLVNPHLDGIRGCIRDQFPKIARLNDLAKDVRKEYEELDNLSKEENFFKAIELGKLTDEELINQFLPHECCSELPSTKDEAILFLQTLSYATITASPNNCASLVKTLSVDFQLSDEEVLQHLCSQSTARLVFLNGLDCYKVANRFKNFFLLLNLSKVNVDLTSEDGAAIEMDLLRNEDCINNYYKYACFFYWYYLWSAPGSVPNEASLDFLHKIREIAFDEEVPLLQSYDDMLRMVASWIRENEGHYDNSLGQALGLANNVAAACFKKEGSLSSSSFFTRSRREINNSGATSSTLRLN